jgi:hypothetical protein
VHLQLLRADARVSLATVYRTLRLLASMALLAAADLNWQLLNSTTITIWFALPAAERRNLIAPRFCKQALMPLPSMVFACLAPGSQ